MCVQRAQTSVIDCADVGGGGVLTTGAVLCCVSFLALWFWVCSVPDVFLCAFTKKLSLWKPMKENNGFIMTLITNKHH